MTNKHSRSTPSPSQIDRGWPHQVALPDELCCLKNFTLIREFCAEHRLQHHVRRVQAIWPDRKYLHYRLYCFTDRAAAELFQSHFGGEFFDPSRDRENGRVKGPWRRTGVWTRLLASGPLLLDESLRT